jgi:hypothetical protein
MLKYSHPRTVFYIRVFYDFSGFGKNPGARAKKKPPRESGGSVSPAGRL